MSEQKKQYPNLNGISTGIKKGELLTLVTQGDNGRLIDKPSLYRVVFFDHDGVPSEYIATILLTYFGCGELEAWELADKIHRNGRIEIGEYTKDVAETKLYQVMTQGKEHQLHFNLDIEPIET